MLIVLAITWLLFWWHLSRWLVRAIVAAVVYWLAKPPKGEKQ